MAKKAEKKLKWSDIEDLAFRLIDEHPQVDPSRLALASILDYVVALPDFGESSKKPGKDLLEELQERWAEERADMDDELGPLEEPTEDLDEDEYRSDRMVDEQDYSDDDEDDDEEDEFDRLDEDDDDEEEDLY